MDRDIINSEEMNMDGWGRIKKDTKASISEIEKLCIIYIRTCIYAEQQHAVYNKIKSGKSLSEIEVQWMRSSCPEIKKHILLIRVNIDNDDTDIMFL